MSDIAFVDFRNGMVSEKLRRRMDLSFYQNSASMIENAVPMRTGGIKQRECLDSLASSFGYKRICPLSPRANEGYLVCFAPYDNTSEDNVFIIDSNGNTKGNGKHQMTAVQLEEMTYAQTYDMMVFAQCDHKPLVVEWKLTGDDYAFIVKDFVPTTKYTVYKDGSRTERYNVLDYVYEDFLNSSEHYPSNVCFVANRLCFSNFKASPYKIFMSKPFEYLDFQEDVTYVTEQSSVTKGLYACALTLQETKVSEKGTQTDNEGNSFPNSYKKEETTVSTAGYYITTVSIVDEDGNLKKSYVRTRKYTFTLNEGTSDEWSKKEEDEYVDGLVNYAEDKAVTQKVTTDDCAIKLELSSDRDETICWMAQSGEYVFIGTTSSEWIMPSGITATQVQCSKLSSYGAKTKAHCVYGGRNIFYVQNGAKKIRSLQYGNDGTAFIETTYQCSDLFSSGVRCMAWQRIPEPRLYATVNGERNVIHVLCYDSDYGVNAWCRWTFEHDIEDICTIDTADGQMVVVLTDGKVMKFVESRVVDGTATYSDKFSTTPFATRLVTNNIDSSSYMAYGKKNYTIYADTFGTNYKARAITGSSATHNSFMECRNTSGQLSKIEAYAIYPHDQGLRVEIQGKPGEEFVLLALIVDMEAQK